MFYLFFLIFYLPFSLFSESLDFPNFVLFDLEGKRYVFYDVINSLPKEAKVILNFTSLTCKPCEKEIPELVAISSQNPNLQLFCIFAESGASVRQKAEKLGLKIAYSDPIDTVQGIFGVKSYPVTVVLDAKGKKIGRYVGYNEKQMKEIKKLVGSE